MILPTQSVSSSLAHIATDSFEEACTSTLIMPHSFDDNSTLITSSSKDHDKLTLWHSYMGHINIDTIHKMSSNDSLCDFKLDKHVQLQHPYERYMLGK